jgi:hypothetical protein
LSRLRKYLALTPAGRAIVLRGLLLLPVVAVLLRARGMARTTALLERLARRAEDDSDALAPQEIARLVHAAASILGAPCLPRALVLSHFLRCRGTPAEIRLGVAKLADGKLSAHAWVEIDGLPLNDGADVCGRYATFPSSPTKFSVDRP